MPRRMTDSQIELRPGDERGVQGSASIAARKIVRSTTVELVTDAIRQRILCGELRPGEVVRQEALADDLGVSRLPIREAISRLRDEGMMAVIPHRGAYVCKLSADEVREAFDIRLRLEPWIFAEALPHISEMDLRKGERIVSQMEDTASKEWGRLNWLFHETLYSPSRRRVSIATLQRLHNVTDRYLSFQVVNVPVREQAGDEHTELIELCRSKAIGRAMEVLENHIRTAADQIVAVVEKVLNLKASRT